MSGYANDEDQQSQRPMLFSENSMREILSNASRTGQHNVGTDLMNSIDSYRQNSGAGQSSPPRSSASRQNSFAPAQHTPPRDSTHTRIDGRTGDKITEWSGEGDPALRVHNYDPEWNDQKPAAPKRSNTSGYKDRNGDYVQEAIGEMGLRTHRPPTPPNERSGANPPVYTSRDREGNTVQQYDGDGENLPLRTHDYSEGAPQRPQGTRSQSSRY